MAYPQALIETDIYMELPQGVKTATGNSKDHVLKLLKNIYGQKQAGRVWNSFLVDKLTSSGYTSSLINDCVFFCDDIIFMVYVDDGIFLDNDGAQLNSLTPKSVLAGTKNSRSEGFWLAKLQAHKHPHHAEAVSTSNGMGLVDPPNPTQGRPVRGVGGGRRRRV